MTAIAKTTTIPLLRRLRHLVRMHCLGPQCQKRWSVKVQREQNGSVSGALQFRSCALTTRPIGRVPKNRECTGCDSMAMKISGYKKYLARVIAANTANRKKSSMRKASPIARKTVCVDCQGRRNSSELQIPVPIVTLNQLGVKRITLCASKVRYFTCLVVSKMQFTSFLSR